VHWKGRLHVRLHGCLVRFLGLGFSFGYSSDPELAFLCCEVFSDACAEDGHTYVTFFPSFLWVLRDFNLTLVDEVWFD
jgi:hypothetical protein